MVMVNRMLMLLINNVDLFFLSFQDKILFEKFNYMQYLLFCYHSFNEFGLMNHGINKISVRSRKFGTRAN